MAILNSASLDFEFLHFLIPSYSKMGMPLLGCSSSQKKQYDHVEAGSAPVSFSHSLLFKGNVFDLAQHLSISKTNQPLSSGALLQSTLPLCQQWGLKSACLLNGFVKWRGSRSINEVSLEGFEERHGQPCTPSLCRAGVLMAGLQPCDTSTLLLSLLPITPNSHFKVEDINSCFNVPIY